MMGALPVDEDRLNYYLCDRHLAKMRAEKEGPEVELLLPGVLSFEMLIEPLVGDASSVTALTGLDSMGQAVPTRRRRLPVQGPRCPRSPPGSSRPSSPSRKAHCRSSAQ